MRHERLSILAQPFLARDSSLFEQPAEKAWPKIAFVFVGDDYCQISPAHLRVFSPGKRAIKAQLMQSLYETTAGNWSQLRHGWQPQTHSG